MKPRFNTSRICPAIFTICLGMSVAAGTQSASAADTITYANPALYTEAAVSSTAASPTITVADGTKYSVGDEIRFTGTTATTNPFNTTATNYFVLSVSGNDLTVSTTPGGAAVSAVNTTTATATALGQNLLVGTNWTGDVAPNSNSQAANFGSTLTGVPGYVVNGTTPGAGQTLYGITFNGGGSSDLTLVSGWTGTLTGQNTLTFATNDATTPKVTLNGNTRIIAFGSTGTGTNSMKLAVAGSQGLVFNSAVATVGTLVGSGMNATSGLPGKNTRLQNVDWTGFSGGITVERGEVSMQTTGGAFPSQILTVGNAQTVTNQQLAGFTLTASATVAALNGNSLGRVYGNNTLTVGNADGSGDFSGVIGKNFAGAASATTLTKTGFGIQTISGIMAGTGALNANAGVLTVSGIVAGTGTVNASGAMLSLNSANTYSNQTNINSGALLEVANASALGGRLAPSSILDITTTVTSTAATVASNSPIVVGESVTGTGIPAGTVVAAYTATSGAVTLSQAATATGTTSATFVGINITTTNLSATATVAINSPIVAGMYVTGAGIPSGTRVSTYVSATGTVTLSQNATATGTVNAAFDGTTSLNTGGTLDLNGQAITEFFNAINGTFINSNTGVTAQVVNEIVGLGNPTFDGPGNITVNNIRHPGGIERRITKNGAVTLTLGGDQSNNRYGLTVNEGNVILAKTVGEAVSRFPLIMNNASSVVTLQGKGDQISNSTDIIATNKNGLQQINEGTLDLNGFNEGFGALGTSTGTEPGGIVTNSNTVTTSTLTLLGLTTSDASDTNATFPGTVSGKLNLVKAGANTQALTGTLSYTGNTTVSGGILSLSSATLANSSTVTIASTGAFLDLTHGLTNQVTALVIGTDPPLADGIYGAVGSADPSDIEIPQITGTGRIKVQSAVASPYASWGAPYGLSAGSEGGDLDNDGLTNFQEFAFGLIPNSGSSVNPILAQVNKTAGTFTYQRLTASGLTYSVWTSPDLVVWTEDLTAVQVPTTVGDNESVLVTLTGPLPLTKLFVRVKAD